MKLSKRLRKLCQTGVPSDPTVFGYKVLWQHWFLSKPALLLMDPLYTSVFPCREP